MVGAMLGHEEFQLFVNKLVIPVATTASLLFSGTPAPLATIFLGGCLTVFLVNCGAKPS
jgi:hypothetical protein